MLLASLMLIAGRTALPPPERPPSFTESMTWEARIDATDPVRPLSMGGLQVKVESTRLAEVRSAIGSGAILHDGDAADSLHWLCYYSVVDSEAVWLSSSEMGGGEVIDGITVAAIPSGASAPPGCSPLPASYRPLRLAGRLGVGASEAEVRTAFGVPEQMGAVWVYAFSGKDGRFDVDASLSFRMHAGKVAGIEMRRVSSD